MDAELEKRMQKKQLSSELILLDWEGLDRTKELQKLLQVDKIKSYDAREQEDVDIK